MDRASCSAGEVRVRVFATPSPEELRRRRTIADETRRAQVSIAPLTVIELRRAAREDEQAIDGRETSMDA